MTKHRLPVLIICLSICCYHLTAAPKSPVAVKKLYATIKPASFAADSLPPPEIMAVIEAAVYAIDNFNVDAVANIYTPNAVIADDEPPYAWNGPTAGVQWVNVVEKTCKSIHLTRFKGTIEAITVYQQNTDNVYLVVPATFKGVLRGKTAYTSKGAFTFVLKHINDKWLIKNQTWIPERGINE